MGITKTTGFTDEILVMTEMLKAIGHPARLAILQYLAEKEQCMCGDLVAELPLAQSTVSQHLAALKNAGLIKGNITGHNLCYCIDATQWNKMLQFLKNIPMSNPQEDCC
ncbi:MAG: ArsR/SmtB family transcription factor [Flavobacterium sp.]